MNTHCEDCGCKVYDGRCTNCHEELYILDQIMELDIDLPSGPDSPFMDKVKWCREDVERKKQLK